MKTEPNDAAFSRPKSGNVIFDQLGLTQREYFAGLAMQGILANPDCDFVNYIAEHCRDAVKYADALIAALNSEKME